MDALIALSPHAAATTRCGCRAPTTPASRRRSSSSASCRTPASSRHDLGRKNFVAQVWDWKETSGSTITRQMRRMGDSVSLEARVLHDGRAALGRRHRHLRLALRRRASSTAASGWSTGTRCCSRPSPTSRSRTRRRRHDVAHPLPVQRRPAARRRRQPMRGMHIATTRPETMLADGALMVHPDDERYTAPGRQAGRPAALRPQDPGHRRRLRRPRVRHGVRQGHRRARLQRLRRSAHAPRPAADRRSSRSTRRSTTTRPRAYRGLDRFDARKAVVRRPRGAGLPREGGPHKHAVPRLRAHRPGRRADAHRPVVRRHDQARRRRHVASPARRSTRSRRGAVRSSPSNGSTPTTSG